MSVLIYDINFRGSELLVWYGTDYAKELGIDDNKEKKKSPKMIGLKTDENKMKKTSEKVVQKTNDLLAKEKSDAENLIGNFLISYNWYEFF